MTKIKVLPCILNGLGYILIQEDKEGEKYLIACGSSKVSQAQSGYSTTELELAAATWAINKCRYWLKGCKTFTLYTDHRPLVGMSKKPLAEIDNDRLLRLFEQISTYSVNFKYIKAALNQVADALSRLPVDAKDEYELGDIANVSVNKIFIGKEDIEVVPRNIVDLAALGSEDDQYCKQVKLFESERDWNNTSEDIRSYKASEHDVSIEDFGRNKLLIYKGSRVIPPHIQRKHILVTIHSTHKSSDAT